MVSLVFDSRRLVFQNRQGDLVRYAVPCRRTPKPGPKFWRLRLDEIKSKRIDGFGLILVEPFDAGFEPGDDVLGGAVVEMRFASRVSSVEKISQIQLGRWADQG